MHDFILLCLDRWVCFYQCVKDNKKQTCMWRISLAGYLFMDTTHHIHFPSQHNNYVYQKRFLMLFEMGTCVSYINPQCLTDIQRGRSKSLWDLLKQSCDLQPWSGCSVYITSAVQQLLPRHDTSALYHWGNRRPSQHQNVNGIITGHS